MARVVACDGTTLYLPTTHPDTISSGPDGFNCYHSRAASTVLLAPAPLCETSSGLILHASLAADTRDERSMLAEQFEHLRPNDLLVLDRGYPAYWLFALLLARQQHFCIRLPQSFSPQVQAFVASGQPCAVIKMQPGHGQQRRDFVQHQLPMDAFSVRLVRVPLKTGQIEILATSLLDASRWPAADFCSAVSATLAHRRRSGISNVACNLEQFGGETPQAIRPEFHASILLHNLAIIAAQDVLAEQELDAATLAPNLTHATHLVRLYLPQLLEDRHQSTGLGQPCLLELLGRSANDGLASPHRHVSQTGRNHAVTGLINDRRVMRGGYFRAGAPQPLCLLVSVPAASASIPSFASSRSKFRLGAGNRRVGEFAE